MLSANQQGDDLLTLAQLVELERLLAEHGAPIAENLAAGASDNQLDLLAAPLGIRLPLELRRWWGWHDGVPFDPNTLAVDRLIGPLFQFIGLEEAVRVSEENRANAIEIDPEDPKELWGPTWLGISQVGRVACDCNVGFEEPTPVLDVDYHHTSHPGAVIARSLGEMVGWWIDALQSGAWRYDTSRRRWLRDLDLIPPERERTGLV